MSNTGAIFAVKSSVNHPPDLQREIWLNKPCGVRPQATMAASSREDGSSVTHRILWPSVTKGYGGLRPRKTRARLTPGFRWSHKPKATIVACSEMPWVFSSDEVLLNTRQTSVCLSVYLSVTPLLGCYLSEPSLLWSIRICAALVFQSPLHCGLLVPGLLRFITVLAAMVYRCSGRCGLSLPRPPLSISSWGLWSIRASKAVVFHCLGHFVI